MSSQNLFAACVATAAMSFLSGCVESNNPAPATAPAQPTTTSGGSESGHHDHGAGPHDGTIADWGAGEYHVEFTVDHDKKETAIYVLDSSDNSPSPVKADKVLLSINDPEFQVELAASPLEGEAGGLSSRFVGTHDSLGIVKEFEGTISAEVDGTPYVAEFKEEAHGAGGHTHAAGDALVWKGEPRELGDLTIQLGHHGKHLHAGDEIEPAVSIIRDDKPVSDAEVFNSLVSVDGKTVLAEEVATVFEPTTEDEPAHYAQGALTIPKDARKFLIRFRIVPSGGEATTFDVEIKVH